MNLEVAWRCPGCNAIRRFDLDLVPGKEYIGPKCDHGSQPRSVMVPLYVHYR